MLKTPVFGFMAKLNSGVSMYMFIPMVFDNFATDDQINTLMNIYTGSKVEIETNRCYECNKPYHQYIQTEHEIYNLLTDKIKKITNLPLRLSYSVISAMTNTDMHYHADNTIPEEGNYILGKPNNGHYYGLPDVSNISWQRNHCHTRYATAVIYLNNLTNTTLNNGATIFPQHDMTILPLAKRMVLFPCDNSAIHGVMHTGKNIRLTALLWFDREV